MLMEFNQDGDSTAISQNKIQNLIKEHEVEEIGRFNKADTTMV